MRERTAAPRAVFLVVIIFFIRALPRLLPQEAAQQRAAAESALRSPSPRSGAGADGAPGRAAWGEADIFSFFKALDAAGAAPAAQPQRATAQLKDQAAQSPAHRVSRDTHGGAAPDQQAMRRLPQQPQEASREDVASLQRSVYELEVGDWL